MKSLLSFLISLSIVACAPAAFADSNVDCTRVGEAANPTEAQATNDYVNLTDGTVSTTAAAEDEYVTPVAFKARDLYAVVDVAPGGTDKWRVTVVDDGTATLVTCDITGTATTCTNIANVATIAKGSKLTVLVSSAQGTGDPDAAAELLVGFCLDK